MAGVSRVVRQGEGEALSVLGVGLRFLCGAEHTGSAWSLMENVIPRDAGPPPHFHAWDEAYYVVSGAVEFEIEGERTTVAAGEFAYVPGGTVHGFRGASDAPSTMLIFDAPAHAGGFFKEMHREVREMPRDAGKIPAIGAAHGIKFVAPAPTDA